MADSQSNAPLRADAGAPTSGVIHVRTRLTADFTVISNALAQRRGSAVTVGVAAYIASVPDNSSVTIAALCDHFSEGEILISRALRELEEAGYLERRRERTPTGQVRTRTYFYDVPGGEPEPDPENPSRRSPSRRPRKRPTTPALTPAPATGQKAAQTPAPAKTETETETPVQVHHADLDPKAVAVLAALRRVDPRLVLSEQDAARLAPGVSRWLTAGLLPTQITDHLTAGLPDRLLTRPAGILAYRLKATPLHHAPAGSTAPPEAPAIAPMQNCDGCDRGFRSPAPGICRDCRRQQAVGQRGRSPEVEAQVGDRVDAA
ncbi:hypothetical protein ACIRVK_15660 [Streptomyces sp. NPDC101152]|uniref:hypothetical protein n=1 Tax=Streptomyces sp. NPDC101152 TaxID=3366116 RepID=UPI00382F59E0